MDFNGLPQTVQNFIEKTIRSREQGKCLDYETCQQILEYAADTGSQKLAGLGLYYLAEFYWKDGDYDSTMQSLTECTGYLKNTDMHELLARTYNLMGGVADRRNNRMVALSSYYNSLQYAEKYHLYYIQGMAESNIAYTLVQMRLREEAIRHYRIALKCYEKADDTYYRNYNRINCMIECGCCYLYLEKAEEALALWEEIDRLVQKAPDSYYSRINIEMYQIPCEAIRGNMSLAEQLADDILGRLSEPEIFEELLDNLVILAGILEKLPDKSRLERLMQIIDEQPLEEHYNTFLDLYPFKSNYILEHGQIQDYVAYTGQYFEIYEKYQKENRQALINVLELQDHLKNVTLDWENMQASNQALESLALHDELTGLANRTYLHEYLTSCFENAYAEEKILGVELMDIDFFKEYNDFYGHLAGDNCLHAIAGVLSGQQCPGRVFCARYGGDEFMIIYTGMTPEEIRGVSEAILQGVRTLHIPHKKSRCSSYVTVSQGVFARIPVGNNREWDFTSRADGLLYYAKNRGRDCVCMSTAKSRDQYTVIK